MYGGLFLAKFGVGDRRASLIDSEACSAKCLSDYAPTGRAGGCESRSGFIYIFII